MLDDRSSGPPPDIWTAANVRYRDREPGHVHAPRRLLMKPQKPEVTRRAFIGSVTAAGAAAVAAGAGGCGLDARMTPGAQTRSTPFAPDGPLLKAGLIGCGGRGCGAAANFLDAGSNLQIVALADVFEDRVTEARRLMKERGQDIPESRCLHRLRCLPEAHRLGRRRRPARHAAALPAAAHGRRRRREEAPLHGKAGRRRRARRHGRDADGRTRVEPRASAS